MKLQTAYVIAVAWMIRTYKHHKNPYTVERSADHLRYMFYYDGEAIPFFTLHVMKNEGLIKEFVRFNGELKLHRIGHPAILLSDDDCQKWDGFRTVHECIDRDVQTFGLFLNQNPVAILWD